MDKNTVFFALSSDIASEFKLKVLAIEGQFESLFSQSSRIENPKSYQQLSKIRYNSDLFVTVQLFDGNVPLTLPIQTSYTSFEQADRGIGSIDKNLNKNLNKSLRPQLPSHLSSSISTSSASILYETNTSYRRVINQWLQLPIYYSQLPLKSKLNFKIYEFVGTEKFLFGECSLELFDPLDGSLKKGNQMVQINLSSTVLGDINLENNYQYEKDLNELQTMVKKLESLESNRSGESISSSNTDGDDWLNALVIKKMTILKKKIIKNNLNHFNLYVELVNFDINIIYDDYIYKTRRYLLNKNISNAPNMLNKNSLKYANLNESLLASKNNSLGNSLMIERNTKNKTNNNTYNNNDKLLEQLIDINSINGNANYPISKIYDPEQYNNQPIESKYHQLERSSLNNNNYKKLTDKNLKPNLNIKKHLNQILNYSSIKQLSNNEKNLIYKFRYYLINNFKLNSHSLNNSNFLNFLLKSINWESNSELNEIREILESLMINNLKISLTNTLELLGPIFDNNVLVRNFAVDNLKQFSDEELNLYLLQLIQALKFDDYMFVNQNTTNTTNNNGNSNNFGSQSNTDFPSIVDIGSKEDVLNLYNSVKYNKNSGPTAVINNSMASSTSSYIFNSSTNENDSNSDDDGSNNMKKKFTLDEDLSPLANFLVYKSIHNKDLGNFFYWYIKLESKDQENDFKLQLIFKKILRVFKKQLKKLDNLKQNEPKVDERVLSRNNSISSDINEVDSSQDSQNPLSRKSTNQSNEGYYNTIKNNVIDRLGKMNLNNNFKKNADITGNELESSVLQEQITFVKKISQLTSSIRNLKKSTPEKQQHLKSYLSKNEAGYRYFDQKNSKPLPLPLNPKIKVLYIIPEKCTVFKSSLSPLKLTFKVYVGANSRSNTDGEEEEDDEDDDQIINGTYSFMYKIGDDLRQDQLIIQIIKLIEKLLKDENLNLKLNPYEILSTDCTEGMLEFIPNLTLDKVLNKYQNVLNFFRQENPYGEFKEEEAQEEVNNDNPTKNITNTVINANNSPSLESNIAEAISGNSLGNTSNLEGIHPKIMDNFVKSCAGYCVITYLLGIGDRHLDNLLICNNGKFFHVDFGYILGKDPKPFPPLMKLPIEIIEGFGGLNSKYFQEFKNYCFICFLTLRKNSNLILNLLELMTYCNIPDLKVDSNGAILKVQEKFKLNLNDEEAIVYFQNLINDSVNAFLPVVIDKLHSLAQYWRA